MGLAITSQRLLVFKAGGAMTLSAKELLSAVPLADVDSVEVGKGMLTKPITLTVRGEPFQVEAPKAANTKEFVGRLRARARRRRRLGGELQHAGPRSLAAATSSLSSGACSARCVSSSACHWTPRQKRSAGRGAPRSSRPARARMTSRPRAEVVDGLVVEAVDLEPAAAGQAVQRRAGA